MAPAQRPQRASERGIVVKGVPIVKAWSRHIQPRVAASRIKRSRPRSPERCQALAMSDCLGKNTHGSFNRIDFSELPITKLYDVRAMFRLSNY